MINWRIFSELLPLLPPIVPKPASAPVVHPDPVVWARTRLAFEPDEAQSELLRAGAHRLALCCCRQWGKSTVTALKSLHLAMARPGTFIVAAAPTQRQASAWLNKVRTFARRLGEAGRREPGYESSLALSNGSRFLALPAAADHVRGPSAVDLLVVDEAALVPDAIYQALMPTLATTDGRMWMLSTPGEPAGLFYDVWHARTGAWSRVHVPATRCGRISEKFLAAQREDLGEERYRREYLCEFTAGADHTLTPEQVDALWDDTLEALNGGRALWRR
jgi:hypothetical protein